MKKEGYRKKKPYLKEKNKTPGLTRVYPSHGSIGSLHRPVFWQTWTGPTTKLTRQADLGLITMIKRIKTKFDIKIN